MHYAPIDPKNLDAFKQLLDNNPELTKLIRTYDKKSGIVIDTNQGKQKGTEVPTGPSVDQMASSGAAAALKNPLA